ncbi:AraC family transcriptional regulator [Roseomonas sp. GC11]|uniref:helix-turn-helix transcriptional regulator n=1 Tax=Roseomonas sp. GC11 TaxID=2950546 RepID=UPI002108DAFA|nr:AraC family transcriptional regulator [Roseomonas sp. GC11]MCQ4160533.1 AraC family transcriptional regulator [Roseomonas sp. GC11]
MPLSTPQLDLQERGLRHAQPTAKPCTLMSELQSRAPAPNQYQGLCHRVGIRPGFDLTLYDFIMTHGFPEGGSMEPGLTVTVLFDGKGRGFLAQPGRPMSDIAIPYAGGMTYLCFGESFIHGRSQLPPAAPFRAVELRLSLDFLESIGMREVFRQAGTGHPICHVALDQVWIGLLATPAAMADAAASLLRLGVTGSANDLLVEKGALELLVAGMALMHAPPRAMVPASRGIGGLQRAQELVTAKPEEPWTIRLLARRVGLNEKQLKQGFRAHFGTTVNGCVQQARLQKAYRLLTENRVSVVEAALAVGYANPSHFARLFRTRFGMAPSALLRLGCT